MAKTKKTFQGSVKPRALTESSSSMEAKTTLPVVLRKDFRPPKEDFSRRDAIERALMNRTEYVAGDISHWYASERQYTLTVIGSKIFWKRTGEFSCTYKNGKFYGQFNTNVLTLVIQAFKLDWITKSDWARKALAERKDLWKMVFNGKITNPELLAKAISKKYFQGKYTYNALKMYYRRHYGISLWDIFYYTTNPDFALRVYLGLIDSNTDRVELGDLIRMAKILDEKINPNWSARRIREVHQRQIEAVNAIDIERISNIPIAESFGAAGLSLILDERTCYLEGCSMHNCVHTCYWEAIKSGQYLIAKGTINNEYVDLGIRVSSSEDYENSGSRLVFDQVHTIYNGRVQEETLSLCVNWIRNHSKALENIVEQIEQHTLIPKLEKYEAEDIPF